MRNLKKFPKERVGLKTSIVLPYPAGSVCYFKHVREVLSVYLHSEYGWSARSTSHHSERHSMKIKTRCLRYFRDYRRRRRYELMIKNRKKLKYV